MRNGAIKGRLELSVSGITRYGIIRLVSVKFKNGDGETDFSLVLADQRPSHSDRLHGAQNDKKNKKTYAINKVGQSGKSTY